MNAIWAISPIKDKRDFLAVPFDTLALRRDDSGLTLIAFLKGDGPTDLSRRGFRKAPGLHPIDATDEAWVIPITSDQPGHDPLADLKAELAQPGARATVDGPRS